MCDWIVKVVRCRHCQWCVLWCQCAALLKQPRLRRWCRCYRRLWCTLLTLHSVYGWFLNNTLGHFTFSQHKWSQYMNTTRCIGHTVFRGPQNFEPSRGICPLQWNFNISAEIWEMTSKAVRSLAWWVMTDSSVTHFSRLTSLVMSFIALLKRKNDFFFLCC